MTLDEAIKEIKIFIEKHPNSNELAFIGICRLENMKDSAASNIKKFKVLVKRTTISLIFGLDQSYDPNLIKPIIVVKKIKDNGIDQFVGFSFLIDAHLKNIATIMEYPLNMRMINDDYGEFTHKADSMAVTIAWNERKYKQIAERTGKTVDEVRSEQQKIFEDAIQYELDNV